jgi:peptide/nickel transport system permease protein
LLKRYIAQRLLLLIPLLLGISMCTFAIAHLAPGDPIATQFGLNPRGMDQATVERLRRELGLNDSLPEQYLRYLGNLLRGDLGRSLTTRAPVLHEIASRFPATLELAIAAMLLAVVVALPLGIASAVRRGTAADHLTMVGAVVGMSVPGFWLGIMLMLLFSLKLGLLPSAGRGSGSLLTALESLILPAVTLATGILGLVTRLMRGSMLEVLGQDYVRTARAKGLGPRLVLVRHALRNALVPTVTTLGVQFAALLGGTVIVETVFAWPGIGRLAVNAIWRRDYPVILGTVLVFSVVVVLTNLVTDILCTMLDPRIRYEGR